MPKKILLITPPFTQLNTPYPATPHLKGFLKQHGCDVFQADLGIELLNAIFSPSGLETLFAFVRKNEPASPNSLRIIENEQYYLQTIEPVMNFLQERDNTLARLLCTEHFLPRASRFDQLPDLEWSFGSVGVNDKARFLATLYIEDIGDLIRDAITPWFGFSRYAENLGLSAHSFSPIQQALLQAENVIDSGLLRLLQKHIEEQQPDVVGITIPFPGNLYSALRCGKFIKDTRPGITVIAGGGFANTELRELSEPAVFKFLDFITLDDGERPFLNIVKFLEGEKTRENLRRTFTRIGDQVRYIDDPGQKDFSHAEAGCPDYSDLPAAQYLSLIDLANPMHRLWSDGRWNKLALAHGCYWHKCSFCDTALDYICRYDPAPVSVLADRIEQIISRTGRRGFHFVDEAAAPALLKELSLELLRRRLPVSWWANIRFENAFTEDVCRLLAASGCIAATGGLETASDRLLKLMNKGISVRQAARVCGNFRNTGIMVHAYLMYGFPTQTAQETVDSLEIVRQLFEEDLLQSAFWHRFTATVHSDTGRNPQKYHIRIVDPGGGGFAKNDLVHEDPEGCDHRAFAQGLNKAVYNFMHGIGTDFPVQEWFDFRVPAVSVRGNLVAAAANSRPAPDHERMNERLLWTENLPRYEKNTRKGNQEGKFFFSVKTERFTMTLDTRTGDWLNSFFEKFSAANARLLRLETVKGDYEKNFSSSFDAFLNSKEWKILRRKGLLMI